MSLGRPKLPVLGIVFNHCKGAGEAVRETSYRLPLLKRDVNIYFFWEVFLGNLDAEKCIEGDNPAGWMLSCWMKWPRGSGGRLRFRAIQKILRNVADEEERELLLNTVQSYYKLNTTEQAEEAQLMDENEEVAEEMMTAFDKRERKGRIEGNVDALLRVLALRFPDEASSVEPRLRTIHSAKVLSNLFDKAVMANSFDEIRPLLPT